MDNDSQELTVQELNKSIKKALDDRCHVIGPAVIQQPPALHQWHLSTITLSPNVADKDVFPQRGGGLTLTAKAMQKLADVVGIEWTISKRVDDGKDPDYIHWRAEGRVKHSDGTWRTIMGDKTINLTVIVEELRDNYTEKAAKLLTADFSERKFKNFTAKTLDEAHDWIKDKVRVDMIQMKKHMQAKAQTGAHARATKSLGIKETWTKEELAKPFLFPKLVYHPDPDNAQDREFLNYQAAGMLGKLYPKGPFSYEPQAPSAPIVSQPQTITIQPAPDMTEGEMTEEYAPDPRATPQPELDEEDDESLSRVDSAALDFAASDKDDQVKMIQQLMGELRIVPKKGKSPSQMSEQERVNIYKALLTTKLS